MKMPLALAVLACLSTIGLAGDHCFVQPYNAVVAPYGSYSQPYAVYDTTQVDVINRLVRLYPAKEHKADTAAEQLVIMEYQKLLDTIPLVPAKQVAPLRKFQFKENTPAYVVQRQTQRQEVKTQVVTQTLQAVVRQIGVALDLTTGGARARIGVA